METFTEARPLVASPHYESDRKAALDGLRIELSKGSIDEPTLDIVDLFSRIPHCYTLQSCFGHFMRAYRVEDVNTDRVADLVDGGSKLHYKIAYLALCIENSVRGRSLLEALRAVPEIDPDNIQFGSADWFWRSCVNSYVLQVSPFKNAYQDHFDVTVQEALRMEKTRDRFFDRLLEVSARNERASRWGRPKSLGNA